MISQRKAFSLLSCLLIFFWLNGCKKDVQLNDSVTLQTYNPTPYKFNLPASFPSMRIPKSNPMTNEGVALGKKLFYDPLLSSNNNKPALAAISKMRLLLIQALVLAEELPVCWVAEIQCRYLILVTLRLGFGMEGLKHWKNKFSIQLPAKMK